MNVVKWSPWRKSTSFEDRMNRFFDDAFLPTVWLDDGLGASGWKPMVDVYESDDKIVIKAELPGVDKKDIEVDLTDHVLTLKGERSYENEVKEENYYRKERAFGKFNRAFNLPTELDRDKIKADFKDGVLKIDIPKPEEQKPKKISIH